MDKKKRNIVIGLIAAIIVVAGICGGVAYANYQEEQRQIAEHNAAVDALVAEYGSQIDALEFDVESENPERAVLLTDLDGLEKLAKSIAEDAGKLTYFDGEKWQFDNLQNRVLQQINAIREWFQTDYLKQYEAAKIADLEAEGVIKDQIAESTQKLTELQALIESEAARGVWGEDDAAKHEELTASITSTIEANNAKFAAIEEAERQAAEAATASGAYAGGSGGSGESYGSGLGGSNGGGTIHYFNTDENGNWDGTGRGGPPTEDPDYVRWLNEHPEYA